jgi:hypothetical protein
MSELTTEQLIKIIIGVLVFVAVIIGVSLFFKFKVVDFFKGYTDEPAKDQTGTTTGTDGTLKPKRLCEDCRGNLPDIFCTKAECDAINLELKKFNLECVFTKVGLIGTRNTCVTSQIK